MTKSHSDSLGQSSYGKVFDLVISAKAIIFLPHKIAFIGSRISIQLFLSDHYLPYYTVIT